MNASLFDKAKYLRKTTLFMQLTEDQLNNKIYDVKEKYKMKDDDLAEINIAISILTQRQIMEKLK